MFRRSRFSVRPNVGTVGRGAAPAATPQETSSANQEAGGTPTNAGETATKQTKQDVTSEKAAASGDGTDQNGEGSSSSAAVQRRKRFSVKPKVAPGRPPTLPRTLRTPVNAASEPVPEVCVSGPEDTLQTTSSHAGHPAAAKGLQSPRRRRSSDGSKSPRGQPKPTQVLPDSVEPSAGPAAKDSPEQTAPPADCSSQSESTSGGQIKEVPPVRPPDKVPPSLPSRETIEISQKAKTLASSQTALSLNASAYSLSRLLNGPSDLQRLVKAQKLRDLLRQERHKEKTRKKSKARFKEYSSDPAKMTMSDLIRYLPMSNPMSCSLEDSVQENESVVPSSPVREESPERAREPEPPPKISNSSQEEEEEEPRGRGEEVEEAEEAEEAGDNEEEALMVPQVKVAEDGSLIIDEESLTVEVLRAKGPNPAQDRDPIFERGSTTTYSSFRKGTYTKPWSSEETDMFFLAVSMVGTDFSMICQLFPHRGRSEIKNKFKKEERVNGWRIDKAFKERRKLDIEYFSKLLEKIMEVQKNRKKLKSLAEKNSTKKRSRKKPAKKRARKLSSVEEVDEEEEEEEEEEPDLGEEGEKENEEVCNEGGSPAAPSQRKNKRKKKASEEPNDKRSKPGKSSEQAEAGVPEDAEAALPEDDTDQDTTGDANSAGDPAIKPAKPSRARAPKPTVPLGRKFGRKPTPSAKPKEAASDEEAANTGEKPPEEQETNEDASTSSQVSRNKAASDESSDEEDEVTVRPPKPTRSGRVPKPTKPLTYPGKEDAVSSAADAGSSASKPKTTAKRGRPAKQPSPPKSKKAKLVTLRASQLEFSDEENEGRWGDEELEAQQLACGSANGGGGNGGAAFVPAGLHTLQPEISEVDETMVELDILASMPDVLGISQEALCPGSSCERAQHETDTSEPCDHQLDLLVDVIDLLSSEHTEVSEEQSYNEAAETLLTIGHVTLDHDYKPDGAKETTNPEEIAAKSSTPEESGSPTVPTVVVKLTSTDGVSGDVTVIDESGHQASKEQKTVGEMEAESQPDPESSNKSPPPAKKARQGKAKLKPNLARTSRAAQPKPEPRPSTAGEAAQERPDQGPTDQRSHQETVVDQLGTSEATPDQNSPEIHSQSSSETQFKPNPTVKDANQTSKSTDETPTCSVGRTDTKVNDSVLPETFISDPVTESSVSQESDNKSTSSAPHSEEGESEVATTNQSRRSRLQKAKPNLSHTSRLTRSKLQTTREPGEEVANPRDTGSTSEMTAESRCETSGAPTELGATADPEPGHKDQVQDTITAPGEEEVPPSREDGRAGSTSQVRRRGRVQQVKPKSNLPQTPRTEGSKQQVVTKPEEKDSSRSLEMEVQAQPAWTPSQSPTTVPTSTVPTEEPPMCAGLPQVDSSGLENENLSESQLVSVGDEVTRVARPTPSASDDNRESHAMLTSTVEEPPATHDEVPAPSASRARKGRCQKVKPTPNLSLTRAVKAKPGEPVGPEQPTSTPSSRPETSDNTTSEVTESNPDSSGAAARSRGDGELESSVDLTEPKTRQIKDPTAGSEVRPLKDGPAESRLTPLQSVEVPDSSQTPIKTPPARRGRLVKPKPSLASRTRPQRHNTTDSGGSQPVDQHVSDTQEPAEGAKEAFSKGEPPLKDLGPQSTSSNAEGIQSFPVFPDMPSDPDEPFFILSLTEIPVPSSGDTGTAEQLPYPPAGGAASGQAPSVSGGSLTSTGDAAILNLLTLPEMGRHPLRDVGAACQVSEDFTVKNPEAPPDAGTETSRSVADGAQTSSTPRGKATSKVQTPSAKCSSPAPAASTSHDAARTRAAATTASPPQAKVQQAQAEVSASPPGEPLGVSQYFLTDIFTEVEDE